MKNIIFDLGGVVVNLAPERTVDSFRKMIPNFTDAQFCGKPDQLRFYSDYETGAIGTPEFYRQFCEHYQTQLSFQSFQDSWNEMFLVLPQERVDLIVRLRSEGKRVFLLSNINPVHAEVMDGVYQSLELPGTFRGHFERAYYSFEMGLRKPDPRIFERVLSENRLVASETLFIDDSLQHVNSAKTLGIQTIHLLKGQTIDTLSL
jgi:FMN phosphatase YigB (HAD superfamily)